MMDYNIKESQVIEYKLKQNELEKLQKINEEFVKQLDNQKILFTGEFFIWVK